MNMHEKDYKRIANYTGLCLIIFVVLFNATGVVAAIIPEIIAPLVSDDIYNSIYSILSIIAYLSSFIVPAIILRAILKRVGVLQPMHLDLNLPKSSLLLIPGTIAVTLAASYINSFLLSVFNVSEEYAQLVGVAETTPYAAYEILLLFVSTAMVPAVCEEFLFRGTILSNLRPFGKGVALIASSVLFGLMHQNPYQILYTTVAGLILGYAYIKTNSIWCPTLIHFFNNAFSVIEQVIMANCGENVANVLIPIMDIGMVLGGFACFVVYLIIDSKKQKIKYAEGSFGQLLEESDAYEQKQLDGRRKIKAFFAPGMIVFIVIALVSVVLTLALLLLVKAGMLVLNV